MKAASARDGGDNLGLRRCAVGTMLLLAVAGFVNAAGVEADQGPAGLSAAVPTTSPSVPSRFDAMPIPRRANAAAADGTSTQSRGADSFFGASRIAMALVVVLGVIFGLRWLGRRVFGLQVAGGSSRGIRVVSRSVISPRQQLMLIQVGRRLVLVGNCGAQMNAICEINDADEVADLLGQLKSGSVTAPLNSFGALFKRSGKQFDEAAGELEQEPDAAAPAHADAAADAIKEDLGGLRQTVRSLAQQFRRG